MYKNEYPSVPPLSSSPKTPQFKPPLPQFHTENSLFDRKKLYNWLL